MTSTTLHESTMVDHESTTSYAIANWFISRSWQENKPLVHDQIQCLVYLAYGWYYAIYGIRLFGDPIVAGNRGPIIESLYGIFHKYRTRPINKKAEECFVNVNGRIEKRECVIVVPESDLPHPYAVSERRQVERNIEKILECVWQECSKISAEQSLYLVTRKGTPWKKIASQYGSNGLRMPIDPDEIYDYFVKTLPTKKQ